MPKLPYRGPPPRYTRLADVSTTDADLPELRYRAGALTLEFKDWRGARRGFHFDDAVTFRWQVAMPLPRGVSYDSAYEVAPSPLVAELAGTEALIHSQLPPPDVLLPWD